MAEDAATVLEQFINDVANLPAEIAHIYEEIQAKDRVLKEHRDSALARDNSLQKFIKNHGSHTENPKEAVYVEQIRKSHKRIEQIQDEKLVLAKKAVDLMDKHVGRLDAKIQDLMRDGLMPPESIINSPYPSNLPINAHTRQPSIRASPSTMGPTRAASFAPASTHPTPASSNLIHSTPVSTPTTSFPPPPSVSTPRDGDTNKRRRLTVQTSAAPAIPSNLASNPSTPGIKPEPVGPNYSNAPSVNTKKRKQSTKREVFTDSSEGEDDDDDDDTGEDKRPYCMCQQVSYGNMVACDAADCPYEWFHWACVDLTKEPPGKWFCPECLSRREKMKSIK
ncbi:inhibitor of growth proteins N-terminal histone-binding-domain-containing protein [Morchella snyderi]|nr:inhibitor of growth proteins N-terminal histone-binding-domain-containing protein [Morchella snyderi]